MAIYARCTSRRKESAYNWRDRPRLITPTGRHTGEGPTVVDLFCGGGGLSYGFKRAGFRVLLGIDIHTPSIDTFTRNHPDSATILGDIKEVSEALISKALSGSDVDVVAGGVPCQGFSLSNRKRWKDDPRNYLFWEFKRVVDLLSPTYVLLENVTGLASTANGSFVIAIEEAMSDAGDGYRVEHRIFNAADFGVPQMRKRIFFLGAERGHPIIWPTPTHGRSGRAPRITVEEALSDLPSLGPGEIGYNYASRPTTPYQRSMRKGDSALTSHAAPRHPKSTTERIARTPPGEPMYESFKQRIRLDPGKPSPTLVSGGIRPQFHHGHPWDARGMTVRERARIMSFPDSFEFDCGIVMGRVLTGQAVPPLLAEAVSKSIHRGLVAKKFRNRLMVWFIENGRDYPWRKADTNPFHVLVAEILLRKTRADAVVPVWNSLIRAYPDPESLAAADVGDLEEMLHGIGLSRIRAKALVKLADLIVRRHMGSLPTDVEALSALPEVGPYIANATLCFAFGIKKPILDANVYRIYTRVFDLPHASELHKATGHWDFAESLLPEDAYRDFNLALLDFAAKTCTARKPDCERCFINDCCSYYSQLRRDRPQEEGGEIAARDSAT